MGTCLEPTSAESFEGIDDPLHKIRQFAEGWKNRPTLEDFNISKSYIEGRMYVLVFFCIAGELDEYIALFRNRQLAYQRHTEDILFGGWLPSEEVDSAHRCNHFRFAESVVYGFDTLSVSENEVVFIGDIHPVKAPKSTISSEVWLLKVNSSLVRNANALYLSRSASYILAGTLVNREVCSSRRSSAAIILSEKSSGKMIKGRSKVVNGIPDNQANDGIDFDDILNHVLGKCRMRIVLGPKFAGVSFEKEFYPRIHITDVVVGPVDL